jgi:putative ABC transport system substrate-binding protein
MKQILLASFFSFQPGNPKSKTQNQKRLGLLIIVFVLVATGAEAQAQPSGQIPRVGFLISSTPTQAAPRVQALQQGLRELGYVEGKNILFEYRYAEGRPAVLPELVAELVDLKVDIIVTETSNAIQAAKNATKTIPIVFTTANDPVGDGQVTSLAKPGGNITGFSSLAPELNGKRLELLKEAVPKLARVAFLMRTPVSRAGQRSVGELRFKDAEVAAKALGLQLQPLRAKGAEDLESAFAAAKSAGIQALMVSPSTFAVTHRKLIIKLATKHQLPAIYPGSEAAEAGGLMSYGLDYLDNHRRAAVYVDKILKGTKPADLPVQQPMKFVFVINLKAAKAIGLTIPPNMLVRAYRVIK